MQLSSPPRGSDRDGPARSSAMKRPRSVSPELERQAKRPGHLFYRQISYSPSAMKAQQAEREARDSFPSLYAVASSLAASSSSSTSGNPPGKASRANLGSGFVSARRPSPASRSISLLSNEYEAVSEPYSTVPVSAAFRNLQATSRSSSTDSFVGRASRLGLREEDMHAFEDDGTDSECMDLEHGYRYSEGSTTAHDIFPDHSPGWSRREGTPFPTSPSVASSVQTTPKRGDRMQITVSPERLGRFAKPKAKFSMGYRKGCERCERKEPNHYTHVDYD